MFVKIGWRSDVWIFFLRVFGFGSFEFFVSYDWNGIWILVEFSGFVVCCLYCY